MFVSLFLALLLAFGAPAAAEDPGEAARAPDTGKGEVILPARLRLGLWHGVMGASLLGPVGSATDTEYWRIAGGMGLGGAVVGVASGFLINPKKGIDQADASAIITAEQLAIWNMTVLAAMPSWYGEPIPLGMAIGAGAGAFAGISGLAFPARDGDRIAWTRTGMFAGLGLGILATSASYTWIVDHRIILGGLLLTSDLGALAGHLLQPKFGLSRAQARGANLGMGLGGAALFAVPWATQGMVLYTPAQVAWITAVGVVGGGVLGYLTLPRRGDGPVELSGPVPSIRRDDTGALQVDLTIVSGRF